MLAALISLSLLSLGPGMVAAGDSAPIADAVADSEAEIASTGEMAADTGGDLGAAWPSLPDYGFAYGMQAHLYWREPSPTLRLIQDAGFGWLKQQVRWEAVEPQPGAYAWSELDRIADGAAAVGVKVLFSVVTAPAWSRARGGVDGPPDDYTLFGNFLRTLAERYKGKVQAYEVWNEQNFSREWGGGRIDAGEYVELLKVGYTSIKEVDPEAIIISGALTPTGFNNPNIAIDDALYLSEMYQYQDGIIRQYADAIGAHAGGFNNPPDDDPGRRTVPSTTFKGHWSFYFRRIEQLRDVMVRYGDADKKFWVTEFGWSTSNRAGGYEYGKDNTEHDQARYLVRALELGRNYGWVGGMFAWNLNFQQIVAASDEKHPFGIIRADGTPRPAYLAVQAMPKS